jgi:hypothetical protein
MFGFSWFWTSQSYTRASSACWSKWIGRRGFAAAEAGASGALDEDEDEDEDEAEGGTTWPRTVSESTALAVADDDAADDPRAKR